MNQLPARQKPLIRVTRRTHKPALGLPLLVLLSACSASPPDNLGVRDGRLAPCPESPNCVNSQTGDEEQRIEPLPLRGSPSQTRALLVKLLADEPRARLIEQETNYLRAEFSSQVLRFVDDVEFLIGEHAVDVRSASRLGYADFGVNRKRIEQLRQRLGEQQ
ncbi:DUF1499 domain-containing protein [Pseudomonas sp. sp1636]|uniref:DUF1499 domain-containing protein n=1 Tax=Pseudomonas sp. sp1636 TaxID=3036707 RepID=UPI0025A592D8|nr:DUF1499 domain-containing protein [Pseudomonas sp. sp1636]MDM8347803.1 DUF1499 domain-containing protein [Pseudomonas sp. sp1636]